MPATAITIEPSQDAIDQAVGMALCMPLAITRTGLTKREHFAAMALQGMVSVCAYDEQVTSKCRAAVEYADALLKELDK